MVEHDLAKVGVAGSSPVFRSEIRFQIAQAVWNFYLNSFGLIIFNQIKDTLVVELVDTRDLKSRSQQCECGFNSHLGYKCSATQKKAIVTDSLF